jgi:hypothetical protein
MMLMRAGTGPAFFLLGRSGNWNGSLVFFYASFRIRLFHHGAHKEFRARASPFFESDISHGKNHFV